jgi:hypothetical protein
MESRPTHALPRRKFTPAEDHKLRSLVETLGTKSWEDIAHFIPDRSARQCRDRYKNYLLESLMADPWTPEEDALVIRQFHLIGPKWVEIGKILSGRSGNNVKNRWHKHLCRLEGAFDPPPAMYPEPAQATGGEGAASAKASGSAEMDWSELFDALDPAVAMDRSSNSGFSFEDSLF